MNHLVLVVWLGLALGSPSRLRAQSFPTDDPVLRAMWSEGMQRSQAMSLLQVLSDSLGPRLTGTPGAAAAQTWIKEVYSKWGIPSRSEQFGTWMGWRRGPSHIDLVAPRVRSLEGVMLAWSPGTKGKPVEGRTVVLQDPGDSTAFAAWLPQVKGRIVLASPPEPSCRTDSSYVQWAGKPAFDDLVRERTALKAAWPATRTVYSGLEAKALAKRLEDAGAIGVITSRWTGGWGATRVFRAQTRVVPTFELSCEDYGLVFRLTERNQGPVIRLSAESEFLGEVPVFNVLAEIKGSEKPGEFVLLSAHFDSWDGGSGSTDNGTGTITMLEAMRILRETYPRPRRTILVGHWNSEENGLIGSRAYAEDHPEVVSGLQAQFNQDNGTGRIESIDAAGLLGAVGSLAGWFSRLPTELSRGIRLEFPGAPRTGGSDNASFACYGAPGFGLDSEDADYSLYTWHTRRDTYDKAIAANLRQNATLTAMLAYLASEDPVKTPRDRRVMAVDSTGKIPPWPACVKPARSWAESTR